MVEEEQGTWRLLVSLHERAVRRISAYAAGRWETNLAVLALVVDGQVHSTWTERPEDKAADLIEISDGFDRSTAAELARRLISEEPTVSTVAPLSPQLQRANEVCSEFASNSGIDNPEFLLAVPGTAGAVVVQLRNLGAPIRVWKDLPPDHFVATCGFGTDPDAPPPPPGPSDPCTDRATAAALARNYFVDEQGRSSLVPATGSETPPDDC